MKHTLLSIGLLVLLGGGALAQQLPASRQGRPNIINYAPADYRGYAQNSGIVEDQRGFLYVANNAGLLQYDGHNWTLGAWLPTARSVDVDARGRVYVGGLGDFGYLAPDSVGRLQYTSLVSLLPAEQRGFSDVWRTFATPYGVFFQTAEAIFRYDPTAPNEAARLVAWTPQGGSRFHLAFMTAGRLLVRQEGLGLFELKNDRLELLPGGGRFANTRIYAALPHAGDGLLLATREEGLLRYVIDGSGLVTIEPFETNAAAYLQQARIYHAVRLPGGGFAIGTLEGGVVLLDQGGDFVAVLNEASGLQDPSTYYLYVNERGSLWMALNNGLSRVELPLAYSQYDEREGLEGSVNALARLGNTLLVGTSQGLYQLNAQAGGGRFARVQGFAQQVWALEASSQGVLVGTQDGLYTYNGGALRQISRDTVLSITATDDPQRFYVGFRSGIGQLDVNGPAITIEDLPGIGLEVRSLAWDKRTGLWATGPSQELWHVQPTAGGSPNVRVYTTAQGLPEGPLSVYEAAPGEVEVRTIAGAYRPQLDAHQEAVSSFMPADYASELKLDLPGPVEYIRPLAEGKRWLYGAGYYYIRSADGSLNLVKPLRQIAEQLGAVEFFDGEGAVWIGGFDGLVRLDLQAALELPNEEPLPVQLLDVVVGTDSLLYGGHYNAEGFAADDLPEDYSLSLRYGFNRLRLNYAAQQAVRPDLTRYRYRLLGQSDEWSPWSAERQKDYTNLPEGKYTFEVQARDAYGQLSAPAQIAVVITPPWFRSWWALVLYIVGVFGVMFGLVQWRSRRLVAERDRLEEKVQERTQEIELQKEEIEEKNRDITDSIHYARRIQEAILPREDFIRQAVADFFVYYKPRDIVSGDFYWYSLRGQDDIILAAVDCTGHGVPGAFMSVMGNTLLNQIVNEHGVREPSAILQELDIRVKATLHQTEAEVQTEKASGEVRNQDGMDVALIRIDKKQGWLSFAGANRPLYIVQNGELKELAGARQAIGGSLFEAHEPYKEQAVPLSEGMVVYLFSDGFVDQFGGPNKRKFMPKRFRDLLMSMHAVPMDEQRRRLAHEHTIWRGELEQMDDLLVMGLRL